MIQKYCYAIYATIPKSEYCIPALKQLCLLSVTLRVITQCVFPALQFNLLSVARGYK